MLGGLAVMIFGLVSFGQSTENPPNLGMLIGSVAVFLALTLGSGIFALTKLSKAKKVLNSYAEQKALPKKEVFREFKKNLKHMKSL